MAPKDHQTLIKEVDAEPARDAAGFAFTGAVMYLCRGCGAEYSEDGLQYLKDRYLGSCCKCGRLSFKPTVILK